MWLEAIGGGVHCYVLNWCMPLLASYATMSLCLWSSWCYCNVGMLLLTIDRSGGVVWMQHYDAPSSRIVPSHCSEHCTL